MKEVKTLMQSRAEQIIERDPNGLVVVDESLNIVQINKAFLNMFEIDIKKTGKIIGNNVNEVLGQMIFPSGNILPECHTIKHHESTGKILQPITFKLEEENLSACFFVDITMRFHNKQKLQEMKKETLEKARTIIDKQMRVAQEIASLLGETTAETKVIFLKLQKVMKGEDEISE